MKRNRQLLIISFMLMLGITVLSGKKNTTAYTKWVLDEIDNGEEPSPSPKPKDNLSENNPQNEDKKADTEKLPTHATFHIVLRRNAKEAIYLTKAKAPVKWFVSNKKIIKILSKNNKRCKIKPLKNGKATITANAKNMKLKFKITVKDGKAFTKAWCKQWVKDNIKKGMNFKEKLICASAYITSSGTFSYGSTSTPEDVISKKMGTCVSGGKLLVEMCKAMGFQAKLRFAAKDKMGRYPVGVVFASQHYNVVVKAKGKKYYIDGTPGSGMVYLCNSKKTLYSRSILDDLPW